MKKYALLDTDFISKTYSIKGDKNKRLIDQILKFPEYEFFCHAKILSELNVYSADISLWLKEKLTKQKIKCYTDENILENLSLIYGLLAYTKYTQLLKTACDVFSKSFFKNYYQVLEDIDYGLISNEEYLEKLQLLDKQIETNNNLGEIKTFVLLQALSIIYGKQVYVFCSDDNDARNGVISFDNVCCISLVSAFSRLKEELCWTIDDAGLYIDSFVRFCQKHNQTNFRVMEASKVRRIKRVSCRLVLEGIFKDQFIELKNGMLRYKN